MASFLFKTEPGDFSIDDLAKAGTAAWDGVSNPQALITLRTVRPGDRVFIYHSGADKRIVGLAAAASAPRQDPRRPGLTPAGEPKFAVVDLTFVARAASDAGTLAAIKDDRQFAGLGLVRHSRLSVMPVPDEMAPALAALAGLPLDAANRPSSTPRRGRSSSGSSARSRPSR